MKKKKSLIIGALLIVVLLLLTIGCDITGIIDDVTTGNDLELTNVAFLSAVSSGGVDNTTDSTALTLTFDVDPTTLTVDNITLTGATKGELTGSGTTRSLGISNITMANGESVTVAITSPSGYSIDGSPQTAVVYRAPAIGMEYQGGIIAYMLQSGDTGYDASVPHGLIAATEDQSDGIIWALEANETNEVPNGTDTAYGSGSENTDNIILQNGAAVTYAAGLARDYNGGGYSDWYLPSKDELDELYSHKTAIGGFTDGSYWSSSTWEFNKVWYQCFDTDEHVSRAYKHIEFRVRAVRDF